MTLQSLLVHTISIEQAVFAKAGAGRQKTFSTLYSALPARIQPISAASAARFRRDDLEVTHTIYVGSTGGGLVTGLNISQADRVAFGTRKFEVRAVRNTDETGLYLTLNCFELKP